MEPYTRPATWEDVKAIARALEAAAANYALVGGYALAAHGFSRFADDRRYAVRINDEVTVDVMPSIAGLDWTQMQPHIVTMTIDGQPIRVLDLAGLLRTKQGSRPKDQMDAAVLQAAIAALGKP